MRRRIGRAARVLGYLVAALVLATSAAARKLPTEPPLLLRLEGYIAGVTPTRAADTRLVLQYQGTDYSFDVTKLVVLSGSRSPSQVLQDVAPYRINFILRGTSQSMSPLISASAGQKLFIFARYRTGTRDLLIDSILNDTPATPTP